MAVDIVLKLEGIEGESLVAAHEKEIDILNYSWGMSQSGSWETGGGGGTGKVSIQDISFVKYVDKATTELMKHCCRVMHVPSGKLILRKGGDNPLDYLVIDLENIIVSSVQCGGSSGGDRMTETFSVAFKKFTVTYNEQSEQGTVASSPTFTFDIAAGPT